MSTTQNRNGYVGKGKRFVGDQCWCPQCQTYKPASDFTGTFGYCKSCRPEYYKSRQRKARPEVISLAERRIRRKERGRLMAQMREDGKSYQEIADEFGISRQYVQQIVGPDPILREFVLDLDGRRCRACGKGEDEARLDIHHLKYEPSLDHMITLCMKCHRTVEQLMQKLLKQSS